MRCGKKRRNARWRRSRRHCSKQAMRLLLCLQAGRGRLLLALSTLPALRVPDAFFLPGRRQQPLMLPCCTCLYVQRPSAPCWAAAAHCWPSPPSRRQQPLMLPALPALRVPDASCLAGANSP